MPTCGLCLRAVPNLRDSHIVPKAISLDMQAGKSLVRVHLEADVGHYSAVRRATGGVYDAILCTDCEARTQQADDELIRFHRNLVGGHAAWRLSPKMNPPTAALREHSANAALIHRFALFTVMRSHLATVPAAEKFRLGDRFEPLRQLLLRDDSTFNQGWDVLIEHVKDYAANVILTARYCSDEPPVAIMQLPHVCIFVGLRPGAVPPEVREVCLEPGPWVTVLHSRRLDAIFRDRFVDSIRKHGHALKRFAQPKNR